jgi:hypothetical protein
VTAASAAAATDRRVFPRGLPHFLLQVAIWMGFVFAYQIARGLADRNPAKAFENGLKVIDIEQRANALFELSIQGAVHSSQLLVTMTAWTYWLSQFTVLGLALLWVYFRRHEVFTRFRNLVMLANLIGLAGYVLIPTAPPRMFRGFGFEDTLGLFSSLNHGSALIELGSNPYAAMPSLHAADALIVGVTVALLVRSRFLKGLWLAWPLWVWFAVIATGNHFWLDIAAGVLVALAAALVLERPTLRRLVRARPL